MKLKFRFPILLLGLFLFPLIVFCQHYPPAEWVEVDTSPLGKNISQLADDVQKVIEEINNLIIYSLPDLEEHFYTETEIQQFLEDKADTPPLIGDSDIPPGITRDAELIAYLQALEESLPDTYYTEDEVDGFLNDKADSPILESALPDSITRDSELESGLSGKSDISHNHDLTYLGISAKAADSNLLDGIDSTGFSLSGHNHIGIYYKEGDSPTFTDITANNLQLVETLGNELIGDGNFDASGTWTYNAGWSYDSTNKEADHAINGTGTLTQSITIVAGTKYKLVYILKNWTVGIVTPSCGGIPFASRGANGTYTEYFEALSTATISFLCSNTARLSIDDVSIKEVLETTGKAEVENLKITKYLQGANQLAFLDVSLGTGDGGADNQQVFYWNVMQFTDVNSDFGNNWNSTTKVYTVPVSGVYSIITKLRIVDSVGYMGEFSICQGVNVVGTSADNPTMLWFSNWPYRSGSVNITLKHYNKGQQLRMYGYCDDEIYASDASMTIQLLYKD